MMDSAEFYLRLLDQILSCCVTFKGGCLKPEPLWCKGTAGFSSLQMCFNRLPVSLVLIAVRLLPCKGYYKPTELCKPTS